MVIIYLILAKMQNQARKTHSFAELIQITGKLLIEFSKKITEEMNQPIRLEQQIKELEKQKMDESKNLQEKIGQPKQLQKKIQQLKKQKDFVSFFSGRKKQQINAEITSYEHKIVQLSKSISLSKASIQKSHECLFQKKKQLSSKRAYIENQKNNIAILSEGIRQLIASYQHKIQAVTKLSNQNQILQRQIDQLNTKNNQQKQTAKKLSIQNQALQKQLNQQQQIIEAQKQAQKSEKVEYRAIGQKLDEKIKEMQGITEKMYQIQAKLNKAAEHKNQLSKRNNDILQQNQVKIEENKNLSLLTVLSKIQQQIQNLNLQNEDLFEINQLNIEMMAKIQMELNEALEEKKKFKEHYLNSQQKCKEEQFLKSALIESQRGSKNTIEALINEFGTEKEQFSENLTKVNELKAKLQSQQREFKCLKEQNQQKSRDLEIKAKQLKILYLQKEQLVEYGQINKEKIAQLQKQLNASLEEKKKLKELHLHSQQKCQQKQTQLTSLREYFEQRSQSEDKVVLQLKQNCKAMIESIFSKERFKQIKQISLAEYTDQ